MSLQVCAYPKCKTITLMDRCETHRDEDFEEDEPVPSAIMNEPKEEPMHGQTCTMKQCEDAAAENSVMCPKHRDAKARSNAKAQGRTWPGEAGRVKRTYTRRHSVEGASVPATRAHAPITLAEPTIVNGSRGVDLSGNAVAVLDTFITKLETDLAMLRGARAVLDAAR